MTRSVLDPFDESCGKLIEVPYIFYLIDHPNGKLLFDTGAHASFIDDATTRLGEGAEKYEILMKAGDDVVSQLRAVGVRPDEVDGVVPSHLHYDHSGGLEFFPSSTVYIQQAELDFARDPAVYQADVYVAADFENVGNWRILNGELDVFEDGKVIIFPTPGHTPGHQSMLVSTDGGCYILVGDAAYDPDKMKARRLPAVLWYPDEIIRSWELLESRAHAYNAELMFSHDMNFRESVRLAPSDWYE